MISNNTVTNHGTYGIYVYGTESVPDILGNNITQGQGYLGVGMGLLCENTSSSDVLEIIGNEFENHLYGMQLHSYYSQSPQFTVTGNNIHHNTDSGIYMRSSIYYPGPMPQINNNNIYSNTLYDLKAGSYQNGVSTIIDAEDNWWGPVDPLVIAEIIYDNNDASNSPIVDFDPFKSSAADEVPIITS